MVCGEIHLEPDKNWKYSLGLLEFFFHLVDRSYGLDAINSWRPTNELTL